ncbi:hypothetical protein LT493_28345 [Streptomyces tricolor]|nr:hypothetical protein [Streptomyces tricolor]
MAAKQKVEGGWEKLFELNKDIVQDADLIYPGQQLHLSDTRLPAGAQGPHSPAGHTEGPRAGRPPILTGSPPRCVFPVRTGAGLFARGPRSPLFRVETKGTVGMSTGRSVGGRRPRDG